MTRLVACLLLVLSACVTPALDPKLVPIMNEFKADAKQRQIPLTIANPTTMHFVTKEEMAEEIDNKPNQQVIGLCVTIGDEFAFVYILEDEYTDTRLRVLVYHELAHCLMDADHYEASIDIMNPILPEIGKSQLKKYEDKMFERLKAESE
jgi:hypothetical protein